MGRKKRSGKCEDDTGFLRDWCVRHEGMIICFVSFSFLVLTIGLAYLISFNNAAISSANSVFFSEKSGLYGSDLEIEIKKEGEYASDDGIIKYTMDGDDVAESGIIYEGKIHLSVPDYGYKVYPLEASVCYDDGRCVDSDIATYVLGKNLKEDVTLDIYSITSAHKNLYDEDNGIMVNGRIYDEHYDTDKEYAMEHRNFMQQGKEWVRNAHLAIVSDQGDVRYDKNIGISISGGSSRAFDLKSFKIMADKSEPFLSVYEYGDMFSTLRVHIGSQDQFSGGIRSSVASRLAGEYGFDGCTKTKRVVLFVNGEYYSTADVQQNYSSDNLASMYGVLEKNIEKYKGNENEIFQELGLRKLFDSDLNEQKNRDELEKMVDMKNYLNYYALQIMLNNVDWPGNNYEVWRVNSGGINDGNKYEDGRLRFLIYDVDLIYYSEGNINWWNGVFEDTFRHIMDNKLGGYNSTFRNVIKTDYYKKIFIDILRNMVNGVFATENVLRIIDEETSKIEHQRSLFDSLENHIIWEDRIGTLREAASKREGEVRADVKKYFGVDL